MNKKETLIIFLLCFISRLPLLLSSNLVLDGDECVVGLMAKHLYEGKGLPLFFYGQSYGFSLIEILSIDLHYFLFGISDISVKLAMLVLWSLGIYLFYKTLIHLNFKNSRVPFLVTLLFIFSPVWAVWSLKARGGYITSFVLCFFITSLIFNENINKKTITWLLTGFLMVLIYQSQPLWLPGLLPLIFYKQYTAFKKEYFISGLSGVFAGAVMFYFLKNGMMSYYRPEVFIFNDNVSKNLTHLPDEIFRSMAGDFHSDIPNLFILTGFWAFCFTSMILIIPAVILFLMNRKKLSDPLLTVFIISILFTLLYVIFLRIFDERYLLPLLGYFLFLVSVLADKIKLKAVFNAVSVFFIFIGAVSLYTFRYCTYEPFQKKNICKLTELLNSKGIHHVFCTNPMVQWEIDFYSKEKVIARFLSSSDRFPEYISSVNNAFNSEKEKVAVTGLLNRCSPFWKEKIIVDSIFFINENPNLLLLSNYGFDMHYPKPKP